MHTLFIRTKIIIGIKSAFQSRNQKKKKKIKHLKVLITMRLNNNKNKPV